jgi:hypothetical protein
MLDEDLAQAMLEEDHLAEVERDPFFGGMDAHEGLGRMTAIMQPPERAQRRQHRQEQMLQLLGVRQPGAGRPLAAPGGPLPPPRQPFPPERRPLPTGVQGLWPFTPPFPPPRQGVPPPTQDPTLRRLPRAVIGHHMPPAPQRQPLLPAFGTDHQQQACAGTRIECGKISSITEVMYRDAVPGPCASVRPVVKVN